MESIAALNKKIKKCKISIRLHPELWCPQEREQLQRVFTLLSVEGDLLKRENKNRFQLQKKIKELKGIMANSNVNDYVVRMEGLLERLKRSQERQDSLKASIYPVSRVLDVLYEKFVIGVKSNM
jgi:hypothetical protein